VSGGRGFLRPEVRPSTVHQRAQRLLCLGTGRLYGKLVITTGVPRKRLDAEFGDIEQEEAATEHEYCIADEDHLPVYVCRDAKMLFREAWPKGEYYD